MEAYHISLQAKPSKNNWAQLCYEKGYKKSVNRNEWSVGLVSNRFRDFMSQWSFEDELFPLIYICDSSCESSYWERRNLTAAYAEDVAKTQKHCIKREIVNVLNSRETRLRASRNHALCKIYLALCATMIFVNVSLNLHSILNFMI